MKQLLALMGMGLSMMPMAFAHEDLSARAIAKTFEASCRFDHPLDTYEGCGSYSLAGQAARDCAENEAILKCQQSYYSDCMVVGTTYLTILSDEFPGYKACEATVTVHGYRLAN